LIGFDNFFSEKLHAPLFFCLEDGGAVLIDLLEWFMKVFLPESLNRMITLKRFVALGLDMLLFFNISRKLKS